MGPSLGDLTDSAGAYISPGAGAVFKVSLTTDAFHTHAVSADGVSGDPATYDGTSQTVGPLSLCTVPVAAKIAIDQSSLSVTYDGKPHSVRATTTPSHVGYSVTYNGSTTALTNAGVYAVKAQPSAIPTGRVPLPEP